VPVIKGVIEAERSDRVLQPDHRVLQRPPPILRDEEGHRRLFEGLLREYKSEGLG
jgi:hypothetical protein